MNGSADVPDAARSQTEAAAEFGPSPTEIHRGWTVRSTTGSARRFHDLDPGVDTGHEIWIHRVDRPAVIFGSTQLPAGFDDRRGVAGSPAVDASAVESRIEVCRRRSGGGLVIVRPDDVWIDAVVPRHSPLHHDDVGLAFHWFGQLWLEALGPLISDSGHDRSALRLAQPLPGRRALDRPFFCFADTGHGEVLHRDRKVVGISQRRTRNWTRLQSLLVSAWNPGEIDDLVDGALTVAGTHTLNRADLGRPPHDASGVQAGFEVDDPPLEIGGVTITQAVLGRLPVVGDDEPPERPLDAPR